MKKIIIRCVSTPFGYAEVTKSEFERLLHNADVREIKYTLEESVSPHNVCVKFLSLSIDN